MNIKKIISLTLFIGLTLSPFTVVENTWADAARATCIRKAVKQKQIAQLKCRRLGGKKKKACNLNAIKAFNSAMSAC